MESDDPNGSSVHLCDGFYQMSCRQMASWFGLSFELTGAEIKSIFGVDIVRDFDEDKREWVELGDEDVAEATFGGPAMGWAWALFFCHDALAWAFREAAASLRLDPTAVGSRTAPVRISRGRAAPAPYVDNSNVLAVTKSSGLALHQAVVKVL